MDSLFFHPKVVHIPIALGVLLPLVAGVMLLAWWRKWLPARSWALVVGLQAVLVGSGVVALQTGEAEEDTVESVVPESAIDEHEEAAEVFVWASAGVLALMLAGLVFSRGRAGIVLAALATLGTLVVLGLGHRTGEAGGALVYRDNAGSAYSTSSRGSPVAPRGRATDDDDDD